MSEDGQSARMTQSDCDRLAAWIETLSGKELNLLWRWITLAWVTKAREEMDARRS